MVGAYCAAYSHRTIQATELRLGHDPDLGTRIMGMGGEGITDRIDLMIVPATPEAIVRIRQRYGAIIGTVGPYFDCGSC
jgi:hypothetical protein